MPAPDGKAEIFVTKSFLPPQAEYERYVSGIWSTRILTNQGPLLREFEQKISAFLGVRNFHYLANGTLALQLALSALDVNEGEVITTPFSYVATISPILWQRCIPVFVDIEPDTFTIDAEKIERAITPRTKAILGVHVFGYACAVDKIGDIAQKHGLKVIYDGAHAFNSKLREKSLLDYGDISTLSFHATKLFHTIEGGACIAKDGAVSDKLELKKRFGHDFDNHVCLGINAKASEFHAAMGLANLPYIETIIAERRAVSEQYDSLLSGIVQHPKIQSGLEYNYAYYPVVFKIGAGIVNGIKALNEQGINPRRYFYPSLNTLPYIKGENCPVSEDISTRIVCLPLYPDLQEEDVARISGVIKGAIK